MKFYLFVIAILALCSIATAIPTTLPVTNITNNGFVLNSAGMASDGWFLWGTQPDWQAVKDYAANGVATVYSSPVMPSTTYYAKACDSTGCDPNTQTFTTLDATPLTQTSMGAPITNLTRNRFNLLYLPYDLATPYTNILPEAQRVSATEIVTGLLFAVFILGFWIRTRGVAIPVILGLLTAGSIMYADVGLHMGIPPEFMGVAYALTVTSMAGMFLTFLKK